MTIPALSSIALFSPIIASNVIFSARRASRGVESMEENPLYGAANFNIAGAQILKGARATKALAVATDPTLKNIQIGAVERITNLFPKTSKIVLNSSITKGVNNVLDKTAKNINPVIIGASALNVATSKDKVDTWARESTSLLTMFAAEEGAKSLIGMPSMITINGKNHVSARKSTGAKLFKAMLSKEQCNFIQNSLNKNKGTKLAFSAGKGLFFAGSSILGYKTGKKISDTILGEKEA